MRNKYLVETLAFANGSSPRRAQIKSSNRYFQIFASFKNQLSYIYKSHNNFNFPHQVNKRIY